MLNLKRKFLILKVSNYKDNPQNWKYQTEIRLLSSKTGGKKTVE